MATVRTSPGPSIGSTCNVDSPSFSLRDDVNASVRPSGDHAGLVSCGPAVTGSGSLSGPASQIRVVVVFSSSSIVATTKAMERPSGDTAGCPAADRRSRIRAQMS